MKRQFLNMLVFLFVISLTINIYSVATAEEIATSTTSTTTATTTAQTEANSPINVGSNKANAALSLLAQQRLKHLADNISNRLEAYIRRIENVINRLESRQKKLANEGRLVENATIHINEARSAIAIAKSSLVTIDNEVADFVGNAKPNDRFEVLKSTYQTSFTAIKNAHSATIAALLILRDAPLTTTDLTATTSKDVSNLNE